MIGKLKTFRSALMAVLALGALGVPAVSAQQGKLTSDGPVKLNISQTGAVGSGSNALTAFGGKIECSASIYDGNKASVTPHELIDAGASAVTITPTYVNCVAESGGVYSTTVDMNGCDYLLHIGEATGGEDTYGVTTDIVCPEGQIVRWTIFSSPAHSLKLCQLTIKPQSGLSGLHVTTNTSPDDLTIVGTLENIHIEKSGICGAQTTTEGKLDIDFTVKGASGEEKATGITVTDAGPGQGELTSDGPVTLNMTEAGTGANSWTVFGLKAECPATYTGHKYDVTPQSYIQSNATTVTITPHYNHEKCFPESAFGGVSTTVDTNGCDYVLHIGGTAGGGQTYDVMTDLVCPEGGKGIQITQFSSAAHTIRLCTITIKPQAGLSGAHVTSDAVNDDLRIAGAIGNIHVEQGGLCGAITTTEGKIHLDVTVVGRNQSGEATGVTVTHS